MEETVYEPLTSAPNPGSFGLLTSTLPWQQILSFLPQAVLIINEQLDVVYCNREFCRFFGFKIANHQMPAVTLKQMISSMNSGFEQQQDAWLFFERLVRARIPAKSNLPALCNQRVATTDYQVVLVAHQPTCHVFVITDDTVNHRALQQAEKERQLYEDILYHIPSDIAVFSPDARYIYLNPAAVKDEQLRSWMIGKTDFEYCEKQQKDNLLAEQRRNKYREATERKTSVEWEEQLINKIGDIEHHLRKMTPVYDTQGELSLLIGYGMDISERKKTEHRILLSEKRYRDLFNYSKAIICTHDLEGNFLTVNPALCESTGYTLEEITGRNIADFMMPDDRGAVNDLYLSPIAADTRAKGVLRILKKDGSIMYLLYQNFKVEEENTPAYIIGFAHDITDRITIERELKKAKKLTEENAKLKQQFIANISHEIRTPMNGIIGMANLLKRTPLKPEQEHFLKIINESAQSLLLIINDILDIEKLAAGQVHIESIPFNIVAKTSSVISLFEYITHQKGIKIDFENHLGDQLTIEGDPTRYSQVLNNLISNAIKFTHIGSIKIKLGIAKEDDKTITLQCSVSDTGIGIEEDKMTKIFEPFTQAYPHTSRKYGGTGLGLSISKSLLELQGGEISVNSTPGLGSEFTFTITYVKAVKKPVDTTVGETKKIAPRDLGNLKILLAEDNEVNQLLAQSILKYWGLQAKTACTGNEVLELLEKEPFDLILMDIQMPEKSGLEAAEEIRKLTDPAKRNIPIIALTANALKGEEKKYIAVGMDDFLTKPFKENELYEVICRVLKNNGSFGRTLSETNSNRTPPCMAETINTNTDKLYDLVLLNDLSRGNDDFILSLVNIFITTVPESCTNMKEAAEAKSWDKVSKLAHKLKSTIDTLNIQSIKQDIRSIEINARNKSGLATINKQVDKVCHVIEQTSAQLKQDFNL